MAANPTATKLSSLSTGNFIGRHSQLERLAPFLIREPGRGLLALARPGAGLTELLRHVHDRVSISGGGSAVYFEIRPSDSNTYEIGSRFAYEVLVDREGQ